MINKGTLNNIYDEIGRIMDILDRMQLPLRNTDKDKTSLQDAWVKLDEAKTYLADIID